MIQMRGKVQGNTTARGATQASWGRSRRSRQLSVVPFPDAGALGVPDGCWGRWNRAMEAHCVRCRCGAVRRARDATPWPPRRCYARAGAQRGTPPLGWCCSSAPRHVGCGCRCPGATHRPHARPSSARVVITTRVARGISTNARHLWGRPAPPTCSDWCRANSVPSSSGWGDGDTAVDMRQVCISPSVRRMDTQYTETPNRSMR